MLVGKFQFKAILKQTEKARRRASPRLSHESAPLPLFYVATMYTNQIEATMLRVHSTNEKAGYNLLSAAEGQTGLS